MNLISSLTAQRNRIQKRAIKLLDEKGKRLDVWLPGLISLIAIIPGKK